VGTCEKLAAHTGGHLHRALSVFLFRSDGAWLLQQRAWDKYHSAGLWTNTCCSHPYPDEPVEQAATRRLQEEMGISVPRTKAFTFVYREQFDNGLTEHEFDHVFFGYHDGPPAPHPAEVAAYRWSFPDRLQREMAVRPEHFTYWFRACFPKVREMWRAQRDDCPHFALSA
jgi:isopentenyl-diphosphate delta-isomerase